MIWSPILLASAVLLLAACATAESPGGSRPGPELRGAPPARGGSRATGERSEAQAPPRDGRRYGFGFGVAREAIQRGEGREALAYYERAAEEFEQRGARLEAGRAHGAAAFVAFRLGMLQKTIRSGLRALELLKQQRQSLDTVERQASAFSLVGGAYRQAGDLEAARRYYHEGLALARPLARTQRVAVQVALLSRNLARLEWSQNNHTAALESALEAVETLERVLAEVPPGAKTDRLRENSRRQLVGALLVVADVSRAMGKLAEAEGALSKAEGHARLTGLAEIDADVMLARGRLALARNDYAHALRHLEAAVTYATRINHARILIRAHDSVARSYAGLGRLEEALAAARRSIELVEDVRSELQEAGLRGGFLEDKQAIYQHAVRFALGAGKPDEAFGFAERSRARAFLDLLGNQATLSKGRTRALVEEEVRLRARLAEAQALAQDGEDSGEAVQARQQVEAAQQAYREFLDRVRKENLEQASLMTVEPVTLQEVQGLLPEGTTLLEYLVTPAETVLWVVERERVEVVRLPVTRRALLGHVKEFRAAIAEGRALAQVEALATALYERLLAGARPHLRGERLLIVPHDALHYLPFSALRTRAGRWLTEEYTLATLPSASVLKYLQGKGQGASARVMAVGNPDVGPALALRYAEREARVVGERFPGARVLTRQEATEARAKALSGQAGLLHFATHGELSEADPLSSALLLVPEGTEDGRLEVRELFGLELNARLVVLSACETGLGQLSRGDELVGLQRAFLYAGTPAVVTTLWKVDDRASFLLMREFYGQLGARGAGEALRTAQRRVMGEFAHPFYWAAFGLTGVPR